MEETPETHSLDRRGFVGLCSVLGLAAAAQAGSAAADPVSGAVATIPFRGGALRFADLTHKLTNAFNMGTSGPRIAMESVDGSGVKVGMKMHRLALIEHTGTHIDAPSHFGDGLTDVGGIPLSDLVVPLVVIDLSARAKADRNIRLMPADIEAWEKRHGRLPDGCCVALNSGWDPIEQNRRNTAEKQFASPGFALETVRMLAQARHVKGIALDAMTLDAAPDVPAYPVHQFWLRSGRWGIEGLTNLSVVPPVGALLVVGAPPVDKATGMPVRALALF